MPTIDATHWICGTVVTTEVSESYDLEEGVALVCPSCQDVWWHYPLARDAATGEAGVDATLARRRLEPGRPRTQRRGPPLMAGWLGPALVLCGLALLLLRAADLGPRSTSAPPTRTSDERGQEQAGERIETTETTQADAALRREAAARREARLRREAAARRAAAGRRAARQCRAASGFRVVSGSGFSLERPAAWVAVRRGGSIVAARSPRSPVSVTVRLIRQPRPPGDLGILARRRLQAALPGGTIGDAAAVRISGRPGSRVSARRGRTLRELVLVSAGSRRFEILVAATTATPQRDLTALGRIVRSFRVS